MARQGSVGLAGVVLLAAVASGFSGAFGTSFNPLTPDPDTPAMNGGDAVFLFHGCTGDAPRSIRPGDVLAVHRPRAGGQSDSVGAVRIVEAISAICFRGEVSAGRVRPYDVLQADNVTCLVIPFEDPCLPITRR